MAPRSNPYLTTWSSPSPAPPIGTTTAPTTPDSRKIPFTPDDLLDKTKENNQTLERILQESELLLEKVRQLEQQKQELEARTNQMELKVGCRGKLHTLECPKMVRLKNERDETLVVYELMKERAKMYGYTYYWM